MRRVAAAGDRGRQREQAPRGHVVDRGARHRQRSDRPSQHPPLGQDPREHGEGGHGHRDAHEEREGQVAHVGREQLVDRQRDEEAEPERERDARVRDERRLADPVAQDLRVELHADEEEVEGEADLGGGGEERHDVRREEVVLGLRPDGAEQGRPEQDPGQHLAHHARLAEPRDQRADEPRGQDHGGDREHQPPEGLLAAPLLGGLGRRSRLGQLLDELAVDALLADRAGERRRGPFAGDLEVDGRRAAADAVDGPGQLVVAEAQLAAGAAADVDELARLDEREALAETGGVRLVEARDRGLRLLVPADRDRHRDRGDEEERHGDVADDQPRSAQTIARRSPSRRKYAIQPGGATSSGRTVWKVPVRATIRSVESSTSCSSFAWSARSATVRTSVRARAVSAPRELDRLAAEVVARRAGSRRSPRRSRARPRPRRSRARGAPAARARRSPGRAGRRGGGSRTRRGRPGRAGRCRGRRAARSTSRRAAAAAGPRSGSSRRASSARRSSRRGRGSGSPSARRPRCARPIDTPWPSPG